MSDFIQLNKEIQKLLDLNEEIISEKIMTKKQAKRKKALKAKKRAEKKAKLQAQQVTEQPKEQDKKEIQVSNDGGDDNNGNNKDNKSDNDDFSTGTALVPYKEGSDKYSYEEMSETFKNLMETIAELMKEFDSQKESALSAWKSKGENSVCPMEEWEKLNTALITMKTEVEKLINNADTDSMEVTELILLDRFTECFNGYLDKAQKQILSAKPNIDQEMLTGEVTDVTTTDDNHTKVSKNEPDDKQNVVVNNNKDKNKRTSKDLVTYKTWKKGWEETDNAWKALGQSIAKLWELIGKKALKSLYELSLNLTSWITDNLFAFLTSPVAKDFVKTLMYSNPITAMIYDGKLGSFGISGAMDKVKKSMQDKIQKAKGLTDPSKANPDNYDIKHFPKNTSNMALREIKWNMEHNKEFIYCINVSYNNKNVRKQEKAELQKQCSIIKKAIAVKNIKSARKSLANIVETLNVICDYMEWEKPSNWMSLWVDKKGNTEKEQDNIDKIATHVKSNDKNIDLKNSIKTYIKDYKSIKKEYPDVDTIVDTMLSDEYGYKDKTNIEKISKEILNVLQKKQTMNTSYIGVQTKLQQLCEQAEA